MKQWIYWYHQHSQIDRWQVIGSANIIDARESLSGNFPPVRKDILNTFSLTHEHSV